jgi:hypothetical protein
VVQAETLKNLSNMQKLVANGVDSIREKNKKKNMVIFQVIPWETFPLGRSSSQQTEGGSFRYSTYTYIC